MTRRYDWSKLDAGWSYHPNTGRGGTLKLHDGATWLGSVTLNYLEETHIDAHGVFDKQALDQLAKCRIRDTEPAPAEQWTAAQSRQMGATYDHGSMIAAYGAPPPPRDWFDLVPPVFVPNDPVAPLTVNHLVFEDLRLPPWRRGPLAAWTMVNISCHDGRLTVVMKRGRGELIDETGPDDDVLWERLGKKVVEIDKAKAAKEKSDV